MILYPAPAAKVPLDIIEKVTYLTPNEHESVLIFGEEETTEELLKKYPEKLVIWNQGDFKSGAGSEGAS